MNGSLAYAHPLQRALPVEAPVGDLVNLPLMVSLLVYQAPSPDGPRRPGEIKLMDCILASSESAEPWATDRGHDAWMAAAADVRKKEAPADGWPTDPGLWVWSGRIMQRPRCPVLGVGTWRRPTVYELYRLNVGERVFDLAAVA